MKKLLATLLTMGMVFSCSTAAFAANETVLTTTVPDATYTLNIPANQEIPFGATSTDIGNVTVMDSSGFAQGKDLEVTAVFEEMKCENTNTTIPYRIHLPYEAFSDSGASDEYLESNGTPLIFHGKVDGTVYEKASASGIPNGHKIRGLEIEINSSDWGKALAGEYSSTITFTAEVVSSQS